MRNLAAGQARPARRGWPGAAGQGEDRRGAAGAGLSRGYPHSNTSCLGGQASIVLLLQSLAAIPGAFIFESASTVEPGSGGEIQLTDSLRLLLRRSPFYAFKFEGKRYDAGDKLGFLKATVEFALQRHDLGGPFRQYLKGLTNSLPSIRLFRRTAARRFAFTGNYVSSVLESRLSRHRFLRK